MVSSWECIWTDRHNCPFQGQEHSPFLPETSEMGSKWSGGVLIHTPQFQQPRPCLPLPNTIEDPASCPSPPSLPQDTLSLMVALCSHQLREGHATREVGAVVLGPWGGEHRSGDSWGAGEVRAILVQEKVGVPLSQAHGTAQVRLVGWPDTRVPWMWCQVCLSELESGDTDPGLQGGPLCAP